MSLLNLARRLRRHDWVAAIIELVIVVVGILLALQVSNWNQDRLDRARADRYYQRIGAELRADRESIDQTVAFWKTVSDYGRGAMAFGDSGQLVEGSPWKTVLAWYQASQLGPFQLEDTTFTEMRDSGDLALIADEGLRKRLADYYRISGGGVIGSILHHDPVYRVQLRGLTPWRVQEYIWTKCFRQLGGTRQALIDCPSPISDAEAVALLETYRASDSLLQNLRFWVSTLRVSAIVLDNARKDAVTLAAEVDAARKR
jgi:hypothetical protein